MRDLLSHLVVDSIRGKLRYLKHNREFHPRCEPGNGSLAKMADSILVYRLNELDPSVCVVCKSDSKFKDSFGMGGDHVNWITSDRPVRHHISILDVETATRSCTFFLLGRVACSNGNWSVELEMGMTQVDQIQENVDDGLKLHTCSAGRQCVYISRQRESVCLN